MLLVISPHLSSAAARLVSDEQLNALLSLVAPSPLPLHAPHRELLLLQLAIQAARCLHASLRLSPVTVASYVTQVRFFFSL